MHTDSTHGWPRRIYAKCARTRVIGPVLNRGAARARRLWTRLAARALTRRYLRNHPTPRLHLGAGGDKPLGWLNTDLFPSAWKMPRVDATRPLRFGDATFDLVFTEHMIEHIPVESGRLLLRECARVLRPGGRIRVSTPDARQLARVLTEPSAPDVKAYLAWSAERLGLPDDATLPAHVVDSLYHGHGHRFLYDEPTLRTELVAAGFVEVVRHDPGESADPRLRELEQHHRVIGPLANRFETLVLEAARP